MSAHQKAFRFSLLTLFHFYCASGQKAIALAEKKLLDKLRKHRFKLQDNVVPMYAMRGRLGLTVYPTGDAYPCHTGPGEPSQRFNCNRLNKAKPEKSDLATFWQHSKFDHATFPSHLRPLFWRHAPAYLRQKVRQFAKLAHHPHSRTSSLFQ